MALTLGLALAAGACQTAECADGLTTVQGTCIPPEGTCGSCGGHEFCELTLVPNQCRCAPGYEGSPCVFKGLIVDEEFLGLEDPESGDPYWDVGPTGGTVEPLAPGSKEGKRGVGTFSARAVCDAGTLTQVVTMPSYSAAQELHVVEVTYQAVGVHGMAVGFDRAWTRLPPTGSEWGTKVFCLGEAAYGAGPSGSEVLIRIAASEQLADCLGPNPGGTIRVDRFTIRPAEADECPRFGEVLNPSALPDGGSWRFETEGSVEGAIASAVGREGTSGARLFRAPGSEGRATMTTKISVPVPSSMESPALVFWWKGSPQQRFEVEAGSYVDLDDRDRQVATLVGTNIGLNEKYCLPPWTHGSVLDLSFSLTEGDLTDATELVIDDVAIVSDPDCGSDTELLDRGFESAPTSWFGASLGSIDEEVRLRTNAAAVHSGNGALELAYWTSAAHLAMETYLLVPESEDDRGPALTFYSTAPATPSAKVRGVLGRGEVVSGDVETTTDWKMNAVCLPPHWGGRWFRFQVRVDATTSPRGQIPKESIFLDDFSLGVSANCPTRQ